MSRPASHQVANKISLGGFARSFNWVFRYPPTPHPTTTEIINRVNSPLAPMLSNRWKSVDKNVLRVYYMAANSISKKSLVRNYHRRRVRHAMYEALKGHNMDGHGRLLSKDGQTVLEQSSRIKGSLEIFTMPGAVGKKHEDIITEAKAVLDKIMSSVQAQQRYAAPRSTPKSLYHKAKEHEQKHD